MRAAEGKAGGVDPHGVAFRLSQVAPEGGDASPTCVHSTAIPRDTGDFSQNPERQRHTPMFRDASVVTAKYYARKLKPEHG